MYSPTFSRLLVYVSVLLFFTSASAKPTGVSKDFLSGSLVERVVQSGRPLKQFDVKLPHASQLGRRQGSLPSALSNAVLSASDSSNPADSSDAHLSVDLSNPSATTANPSSDVANVAGDITGSGSATNSNPPLDIKSSTLAIDLTGRPVPVTQGAKFPFTLSGISLSDFFGSIGASGSTTAPSSTSASGSSTGPGGIVSAQVDALPIGLSSAVGTILDPVDTAPGVLAAVDAPLPIVPSGSNPTTSSGSSSGPTVNIHPAGVSTETTADTGLLGGPGGNFVQPPSGPTTNVVTNLPAFDIAGSDFATGTIPNPGPNTINSLAFTVSDIPDVTVSPGGVSTAAQGLPVIAANLAGDVASGVVSGGVAGGAAQASTNPTAQSNNTPLISTVQTDAALLAVEHAANLDANANAALKAP